MVQGSDKDIIQVLGLLVIEEEIVVLVLIEAWLAGSA